MPYFNDLGWIFSDLKAFNGTIKMSRQIFVVVLKREWRYMHQVHMDTWCLMNYLTLILEKNLIWRSPPKTKTNLWRIWALYFVYLWLNLNFLSQEWYSTRWFFIFDFYFYLSWFLCSCDIAKIWYLALVRFSTWI